MIARALSVTVAMVMVAACVPRMQTPDSNASQSEIDPVNVDVTHYRGTSAEGICLAQTAVVGGLTILSLYQGKRDAIYSDLRFGAASPSGKIRFCESSRIDVSNPVTKSKYWTDAENQRKHFDLSCDHTDIDGNRRVGKVLLVASSEGAPIEAAADIQLKSSGLFGLGRRLLLSQNIYCKNMTAISAEEFSQLKVQ